MFSNFNEEKEEKKDLYEEESTKTNVNVWITLYELENSIKNQEKTDFILSHLEVLQNAFDNSLVFPLEFVKIYNTIPILLKIITENEFLPTLSPINFEIWKISFHILCYHFCRNEEAAKELYSHDFITLVMDLLYKIEFSLPICIPLIYSLSILTRMNSDIVTTFLTENFINNIVRIRYLIKEYEINEEDLNANLINEEDKHNIDRVICHLLTTIISCSNHQIEPLIIKSLNDFSFIFEEQYKYNEIKEIFDSIRDNFITENLIKETNIIQISRELLNNDEIGGESFISILLFLKTLTDSLPLYNDFWNLDIFNILTKFTSFEIQIQDNFFCILDQIIISSQEIMNSFLVSKLFPIIIEYLEKEEYLLSSHASILLMLCIINDKNFIEKCCLETNLLEKLDSLSDNDNPFIQNILISFLITTYSVMSQTEDLLQIFQEQTANYIFDLIDILLDVDDEIIVEKTFQLKSMISE